MFKVTLPLCLVEIRSGKQESKSCKYILAKKILSKIFSTKH